MQTKHASITLKWLTWNDVEKLTAIIVRRLKRKKFFPDIIVGIARGGIVPARLLSDALGVEDLAVVRATLYTDIGVQGKLTVVQRVPPHLVRNKHVLIVDDVADSGKTLRALVNEMKRYTSHVCSVTLHYKPHSVFIPDIYAEMTKEWIVYPWEAIETRRALKKKVK